MGLLVTAGIAAAAVKLGGVAFTGAGNKKANRMEEAAKVKPVMRRKAGRAAAPLPGSPGGVSAGLKLWLSADNTANVTLNGNTASDWADNSNNGFVFSQATSASQPTYNTTSGLFNFNPALTFNGSNNLISTTTGGMFGPSAIADLNIFAVARTRTWTEGGIFGVTTSVDAQRISIMLPRSANGQIYWDAGNWDSNSNRLLEGWGTSQTTRPYVWSFTSSSSATPVFQRIYRDGLLLNADATMSTFTLPAGSDDTQLGSAYDGQIAELLVYTGALTANQQTQIESYLAVKYGISLDQATPGDYLAADGVTRIWDASGKSAYSNNIFGIGRDDAESLTQKQSRSINTNILTLSLGAPAATNQANSNSFSQDISYLLMGDNGQPLTLNVPVTGLTNANTISQRIWQVQRTNMGEDVTLTIDKSLLPAATRILVSTDNVFGGGDFVKVIDPVSGSVTLSPAELPDGAFVTVGANVKFPGGVTGAVLWLRADNGIASTTDGDPIPQWKDQSSQANDAVQVTSGSQPLYRNNAANNINFNPVVKTDGTDDNLVVPYKPELNQDVTAYCVYRIGFRSTSTLYSPIASRILPSGSGQIGWGYYLYVPNGATSANRYWYTGNKSYNSLTGNGTYTPGLPEIAGMDATLGTTNNSTKHIYINGATVGTVTNQNYATNTSGDLYIGGNNDNPSSTAFVNGDIAEAIVFPGVISATDRQRVESYLAIKYGITLNDGATDYLASDGVTKIWDASGKSAYSNNIFGIGRDDAESLTQKQSRSINTTNGGNYLTLSLGAPAATNLDNGNSFSQDISYLLLGDNGKPLFNTVALTGLTGINMVSERIWQVQRTNMPDKVTIQVDKAMLNFTHILISTDATFGAGDVVKPLGTGGSVVLNSGELPDGAFVTVATEVKPLLPGGVAGATLWLRPDMGISVTDGSPLSQWNDQSVMANNGTQIIQSIQPSYRDNATDNINFNPVVKFDGNQSMDLDGTKLPLDTTARSVLAFGSSAYIPVGDDRFMIAWGAPGTTMGLGIHNGGAGRLYAGAADGFIIPYPYIWGKDVPNELDFTWAGGTNGTVNIYNKMQARGTDARTWSTGSGGAWLGQLTYYGQWIGSIGDVIVYNRVLTDIERLRINTYLAIKYGYALYQNAGTNTYNNYVATDGTVIWDAKQNAAYNNRVFGIGRDTIEGLEQKQSRSVYDTNDGNCLTVALGTIAPTNKKNTSTFSAADKSYLLLGDNGEPLNRTVAATGLTGINTVSEHVWRVQRTNMPDNVTIQRVDKAGMNFTHIVISTDATFGAGDVVKPLRADGSVVLSSTELPDGAYMTMGTTAKLPGGVAGATLWLRPDMGIYATDGNTVSQWYDQSGAGNNGTAYSPPFYRNNDTDNVNFNPVLEFGHGDPYDWFELNLDASLLPTGITSRTVIGVGIFYVEKQGFEKKLRNVKADLKRSAFL